MATLPLRRAAMNGDMKMNAQLTKLLKELMADMTRAIKKAEEAIGKIAPHTLLTPAETESTASSR
jgi:hypothetical protein